MSTKARRVLGDENVPILYTMSDLPGHKPRLRPPDTLVYDFAKRSPALTKTNPVSVQDDSDDTMDIRTQPPNTPRFSFYVNDQDPASLGSQTIATPIAGIRTPRLSTALHSHPTSSKRLTSRTSRTSRTSSPSNEGSTKNPTLRRNTPSAPNLSHKHHGGHQQDQHQRPSTAFDSNDSTSDTRAPRHRLLSIFFSRTSSSDRSKRSIPRSDPNELSPARLPKRAISAEQLSAQDPDTIRSMSSTEGFTALDSETLSEFSQEQGAAETPVVKGGPSFRYANTRKLSVEETLHLASATDALDQDLYVSDGGIVHERPIMAMRKPATKLLNADALAKLEASTSKTLSSIVTGLDEERDKQKTILKGQPRRSGSRQKSNIAKSVLQEQSFFAFSDSDDSDHDGSVKPVKAIYDQGSSGKANRDTIRDSNGFKTRAQPLTSRWSPSTIPSTLEHPKSNRTSWISSSPTVYHPAASHVESLANSLSSLGGNRSDESHLMAVTSEEAAFLSSMRRKRASIRRHLVNEGYRMAIEQEYRNLSGSDRRSSSRRDNENTTDADIDSRFEEVLSPETRDRRASLTTTTVETTEADFTSSSPPRGRPTSIKITTTTRLSAKPSTKRLTAIEGQMWRDIDGETTDTENDSPIHPTHRRTQGDSAPLNPIISSKLDDSDDGLDAFISSRNKVHHRKRLSKLLGVSQGTSSSWWDNPSEDEVFLTPASDLSNKTPQVDVIDLEAEQKRQAKNKKKRRSAAIDVLAAWGDLGGD